MIQFLQIGDKDQSLLTAEAVVKAMFSTSFLSPNPHGVIQQELDDICTFNGLHQRRRSPNLGSSGLIHSCW